MWRIEQKYETSQGIIAALDNLSFKAKKGEFIAIMGNLARLNHIVHMIGGIDRPDSGMIYIKDEITSKPSDR